MIPTFQKKKEEKSYWSETSGQFGGLICTTKSQSIRFRNIQMYDTSILIKS